MNLKNLGDQRTRMGEYVKKEEALYNKLEQDLKEKRFKKGTPQKNILSEYGQPVFSRVLNDDSGIKLCLIYRHPTEFFSSDIIYLYFDVKEKLASWEIKPAPLAEGKRESGEDSGP